MDVLLMFNEAAAAANTIPLSRNCTRIHIFGGQEYMQVLYSY